MDSAFIDLEVAGTRDPGAHLSAEAAQSSSHAHPPLAREQGALGAENEGGVEAAQERGRLCLEAFYGQGLATASKCCPKPPLLLAQLMELSRTPRSPESPDP